MDRFKVIELDGWQPDEFTRYWNDDMAAMVFHNAAPLIDLIRSFELFESHPGTRERTGDASGLYLGTYHWGKSASEYASECDRHRGQVDDFLAASGLGTIWRDALAAADAYAARNGGRVRTATWGATEACSPLVRLWHGEGEYSLVPHEDSSQCRTPGQEGFEIQEELARIRSLNLCIRNDGGGRLHLWDVKPSRRMKEDLHIGWEGGPYPQSFVRGYDTIELDIAAGDLYIFDGSYVHAVGETYGKRATVSTLMARKGNDIIYWT
jgi:hypothetical protein